MSDRPPGPPAPFTRRDLDLMCGIVLAAWGAAVDRDWGQRPRTAEVSPP